MDVNKWGKKCDNMVNLISLSLLNNSILLKHKENFLL